MFILQEKYLDFYNYLSIGINLPRKPQEPKCRLENESSVSLCLMCKEPRYGKILFGFDNSQYESNLMVLCQDCLKSMGETAINTFNLETGDVVKPPVVNL